MSEPATILLVDDEQANLRAMTKLLSELSCTVLAAQTGRQALSIVAEHELAAILLDVNMPEMDGFEVARRARELPTPWARHVPIIFVTGSNDTEDSIFQGYESGAVDVLFKPVNAHVLLSKVSVFVELHRSRKQLADEIEAHKRTLADLDAFNYSVSHDLRAPLRPLEGFSNILLEDHADKLDDDGKHLLSRIALAARRMNGLIDDLLRLSNVSRARPTFARVDMTTLAKRIIDDLRLDDSGRAVEVDIAPGITAYGDGALVRIALENLLRNAWKFTGRTSAPKIEVGTHTVDGEQVYFVRDNGVGFDQAHASRLFLPFQRLHRSAEFEGTGIGLAIVERVVRHHGGRIWVDAAPDEGATFSFTLPREAS